jgi:hypothetical protein
MPLGTWWWRHGKSKAAIRINSDFKDLLQEFSVAEVRYLIVGGYAVVHYARPRFTRDPDLWIEPTDANAKRVLQALRRFGIPLIDVEPDDFASPSFQYVIGMPPVQFDFLTSIPGLDFAEAWESRKRVEIAANLSVNFIGLEDLRTAKKHAGRPQDLVDLESLENPDT